VLGGLLLLAEFSDLLTVLDEFLGYGILVVPLGEKGGLFLEPVLEGVRLG